jgi:hypothetical protein
MQVALPGIVILVIFMLGAPVRTGRPDTGGQRQTRTLLFELYFRLPFFTQLTVVANVCSLPVR